VAFHQPGWSCSLHDADPGVIARWMPLFRKTAVDLVLAGHNHTYERFAGRDGVPYVTTGGGGATLYPSVRSTCRGAGKVVTTKTVHHALRITATRGELTVEAIGTDGTTFDRFSIRHFSAP
jgi:2',3'-cyclic-nucleotide 2'-phosphodiesterase (5'-nucleotidase family)